MDTYDWIIPQQGLCFLPPGKTYELKSRALLECPRHGVFSVHDFTSTVFLSAIFARVCCGSERVIFRLQSFTSGKWQDEITNDFPAGIPFFLEQSRERTES